MSEELTEGIIKYVFSLADPDGGFQASPHPNWLGIADGKVSEISSVTYAAEIAEILGAELPHKSKSIEYIRARQHPDGYFRNLAPFPGVPTMAYCEYNTCVGLRGLAALGATPKYDPRPWLASNIRMLENGTSVGSYFYDFCANAYAALREPMPADCAKLLQDTLVSFQDPETGWIVSPHQASDKPFELNNPMTFHAARAFHLMGATIPMADRIVETFLRLQQDDGSWSKGGVHGTFDACVTLRMLSDGSQRYQASVSRAADWTLSCRTDDGGFNHFGNSAPEFFAKERGNLSEMDAVYFHTATLAMAGVLPMNNSPENNWAGWGHTLRRVNSQFKK